MLSDCKCYVLFQELEKCMLNLRVECLDIDQSLNLARAHALNDGLISIWTRALEDYLAPLQELVPKIVTSLNGGNSSDNF